MKLKDYLLVEKQKSTKQMASEIVSQFMDDLDYSIKNYFGGWPDDVIGRSGRDELYKEIYKEIAKWVKKKK